MEKQYKVSSFLAIRYKMTKTYEDVPFQEAFQQVRNAMSRLALMHLAYSQTLVNQMGEKQAEEIILKSIMEYGRLIEEYTKKTNQDINQPK